MKYVLAADAVMGFHFLFIAFALFGSFLVLWKRWILWLHRALHRPHHLSRWAHAKRAIPRARGADRRQPDRLFARMASSASTPSSIASDALSFAASIFSSG